MPIGLDASRSASAKHTGVEYYSNSILQAILKDSTQSENYVIYTPRLIPFLPKKLQKILVFPRFWTLIRLSIEMLLHPPKALFVPSHVLPFFCPSTSYTMVHDVAFKKQGQAYGYFQKLFLDWSTRRALKKAKKVLVPSLAVQKDLEHFYHADPQNIVLCHHGIPALAQPSHSAIQKTLNHYKIPENQALFVFIGRLESKKNIVRLLEAWALLQAEGLKATLFLGGKAGFGYESIAKKLQDPRLQGSVLAPGYISEEEVSALLHHATAFIMPSLEEGFGLTILQSFEANCPVICSKIPSLEEVAGEAALYIDPEDTQSILFGIKQMLDAKTATSFREKGAQQKSKFSWAHAGEKVRELLESS